MFVKSNFVIFVCVCVFPLLFANTKTDTFRWCCTFITQAKTKRVKIRGNFSQLFARIVPTTGFQQKLVINQLLHNAYHRSKWPKSFQYSVRRLKPAIFALHVFLLECCEIIFGNEPNCCDSTFICSSLLIILYLSIFVQQYPYSLAKLSFFGSNAFRILM